MHKKKNKDNDSKKSLSRFFSSINWDRTFHGLAFILTAAVIVIAAWLVLCNINSNVYGDKAKDEVVTGKVLIDVSVSDTLTRGMDDKLNRVLQYLFEIKQDSVAVEVRKVHNQQ